jgi:tetratricopeptide (TPR) repeat protein
LSPIRSKALKQLAVRLLKAGFMVVLAAGVAWNVCLGVADWLAAQNKPDDLRYAMRLMPLNPAYSAQLANGFFFSDPASAEALLDRAVKLDPYYAVAWIHLGLLYEGDNNLPPAEQALVQAAKVDSTFLPAWSLANFYFRHERTDLFWKWARNAAEMVPHDASPLFRLAWYVKPNVGEIESQLQIHRPSVDIQFLNLLMAEKRPEGVSQVAMHILTKDDGSSSEALSSSCEWLIQNKRPDLALPIWNGLAERHKIAYSSLAAGSANAITNGSFSKSPTSVGFDWHLGNQRGVSVFLNTSPNALGFEFSGDEAENALLMYQVAPVQPKSFYTLTIDYSTSQIPDRSGIEWVVTDQQSVAVLARSGSLSAERGVSSATCFLIPDGVRFVNVALQYQRQPGTVQVEGKIAFKEVALAPGTSKECRQAGEI